MKMNIDKNTFVDILGLPENDVKIIEMRKALSAPKPLLDDFFKEYGGTSIPLEEYRAELFFGDASKISAITMESYGNNELLFSGIDLKKDAKKMIPLPFDLTFKDSIDVVYDKLGKLENYVSKNSPQKIWDLKLKNGNNALLYIMFNSGKYKNISKISIYLYTPSLGEVLKDIKVK